MGTNGYQPVHSPVSFRPKLSLVPSRPGKRKTSEDATNLIETLDAGLTDRSRLASNFDALRHTEKELRSERDRLNLLLEMTGQIVSTLELRDLLHTASATVRRTMRCDAVAFHLSDEERGCLRLFA